MSTGSARVTRPQSSEIIDRLIEQLLDSHVLTLDSLGRARAAAHASKERIDIALVKLGLVNEHAVVNEWFTLLDIPVIEADGFPEHPIFEDQLQSRFLRSASIIPLEVDGEFIRIAVVDPLDEFAPAAVAARIGLRVSRVLASPSLFEKAFARLYPNDRAGRGDSSAINADVAAGDITRLRDLSNDAPAIHFVNTIIERAVSMSASDIHITTSRRGTRLRFRIDGVLQDMAPHSANLHAAIVSRLKVLADLDIAERRLPQDGRIRIGVGGREIDLRMATMPHLEGEGVVLRILDRSAIRLDLPGLGFSQSIEVSLKQILTEPHGMFLVTGPTGSGKTTTLYAALQLLVKPERNVISVEDPVEYHLDGVAQIQVQRKIGLDFPTVLRSVLRQDPDVIMIGEVRDAETASIANQAALTGHFVLATLHTNSAAAALPRLIDMGLEPYLIASTVRGILSQRLVRKLCPACSRVAATDDLAARKSLDDLCRRAAMMANVANVREAVGCARCKNTGYSGRTVVTELIVVTDKIRAAVLDKSDSTRLETLARNAGSVPLFASGTELVLRGETTVSELLRVTGEAVAA